MHIHTKKFGIDGIGQKIVKSQKVDFWLWKVKLWPALYSNVIWILEKWMRIHARVVGISQDGQNGKKSKYWLLT